MIRIHAHAITLGAVGLLAAPGAATELKPELLQQVDALFDAISGTTDPGCAVGIMRGGDVMYSRAFGAANVAYGAANTPQTVFDIASGSKSFTTACVALLMDQGRLQPDDDIRDLVPELQLKIPVQLRHLLRCESGIWAQFHIMPLAGWDNVPLHSPYTKEDLLTVLAGQKTLPFRPGSQFQYGSGDTFLLGIVVERVSGQSLAEFARENLFRPLGMNRTWYLEDPGLAVPNRAVGHWQSEAGWATGEHGPPVRWRLWQANAWPGGGAGVVTCVEDLLRWSRIYQERLLPRGKYMDEFTSRGCILGNRFVLDLDAYLKHVHKHPLNPPEGEYRGARRIQITGGYWGFTACLSHFPEYDCTIICLSNNDQIAAFETARKISDIVLGDALEPKPGQIEDDVDFIKLSRGQLTRLVGSYRRTGNHPIVRVKSQAESLLLVDAFGNQSTLKPLSATRFKPVGESPFRPSAVFEFDAGEGPPPGVKLSSINHGVHEVLLFQRVTEAEEYTREALQAFAGTYISEELGAIYRVRFAAGRLQLRVGSRRWESLAPLEADEFTPLVKDPHNTRFLRFTRDQAGNVDGFSIGFWRIHGVRFDREKAD